MRRRAGVAMGALAVAGLSWSGWGVFGIGTPPSPAAALVASASQEGRLASRVPVPLMLGRRGPGGEVVWQRTLTDSSLIGVADVLGTGRADLVVQTGDELQVLNADTGVTVLAIGLPARTVVLGLVPAAGAAARAAGVVLLSSDIGPLENDSRITVLTGPVLAPVWTRDIDVTALLANSRSYMYPDWLKGPQNQRN